MIISNKTLLTVSGLLLTGLLFFSSSLSLAEKHDHKAEHKEETAHKDNDGHDHASEHKEESDHEDKNEHDHDEDQHKETDGKQGEEDGHGEVQHKESSDKHGQDDDHGHDEEAAADVELSMKQIQQAGIKTLRLNKQAVSKQISALSEVKLNQYRTVQVSPTITTRVEKRHVRLGDSVKKNDLLVTLHTITTTDISANMLATADLAASSAELAVSIAEAKGELAAATATWNRLRSLGRDAVSGKRYTEAKIAKEQAEAKLKAYGKSQSQVNSLLASGSKAVQKHFELRAEQDGMIIKDDFVLGQVVTPEDVLFEISDISKPWVEANIKPDDVTDIEKGAKARIQAGDNTLQGKVINIGRILDEETRTLPVRIEVDNKSEILYPGQFVKTIISSKTTHAGITVPAEAVLRSTDGDWVLFVEKAPGRFEPKEVEVIENLGDKLVVDGIESGITIISKGAFTVQSELAKSGFSVHNH